MRVAAMRIDQEYGPPRVAESATSRQGFVTVGKEYEVQAGGAVSSVRFSCPCCGQRTLPEAPPGTFAICPVCYWEDDDVQFKDQQYQGGANSVSLEEARRNYSEFGAAAEVFRPLVRPATPERANSRPRR